MARHVKFSKHEFSHTRWERIPLRSQHLEMVLICVRLIGVYILYCIVLRVGMWRLYRCVIYSNSFWAGPFFFGSRSADRSPVVNIEASSAVVALS